MKSKQTGKQIWPVLVAVCLAIVGCSGQQPAHLAQPSATSNPSAALEGELVVVTSGGKFEEALRTHFFDPFTQETGVKVIPVSANTAEQWAKAKVMSESGNTSWDIVTINAGEEIIHSSLLKPINCEDLPNVKVFGMPGTCKNNSVVRTLGGNVILALDTTAFPEGKQPQTWQDFWNVKDFPGPRALPNVGWPWEVLAVALMADGVPKDQLIPLDLDRAFRKLDEIRPHVRVWWQTGDQSQQIFRNKEVVMSGMWSGRVKNLQNEGVPIKMVWNQGVTVNAYWGILHDAPHPKTAEAFLNFFLAHPEQHKKFTQQIGYDTANIKVLDGLSETELKEKASHKENWEKMVDISGNPWVIENREMILKRWNEWLAK